MRNKRKYRKVFYKGDSVYHVSNKGFRLYGIVKETFKNKVCVIESYPTYFCVGWHNKKKVFLNFHHINNQ